MVGNGWKPSIILAENSVWCGKGPESVSALKTIFSLDIRQSQEVQQMLTSKTSFLYPKSMLFKFETIAPNGSEVILISF